MASSDRVLQVMEQLSRQNPFSGVPDLIDPLRPDEKNIPSHLSSAERLPYIQQQINLLCYNRLPQTFFNLEKHRPLRSILMTGKETLQEALPIRCLEATFVALYLTQGLKDVMRIPLSFRTQVKRTRYSHIVLVVHLRNPTPLYGTLGLSRKRTLMYKPLTFSTLFDLILDYKQAYQRLGHRMLDVKLGLAVPHRTDFAHAICWRFVALRFERFHDKADKAASGRASHDLGFSPSRDHEAGQEQGDSDTRRQSTPDAEDPANQLFDSIVDESPRSSCSTASSTGHQAILEGVAAPIEAFHERSPSSETFGPVRQISIEEDRVLYQSLADFLQKYSHLLPTMSTQYCKPHHRDLTGVNNKVFFSNLEELDEPKSENQRRIECIQKQRSPLDLGLIKAASRPKPPKEKGKK
ncbi:unnamed protein product [Phytomonas sp. Hart1]|nr:unnamed protein product [Phytomonas sp. Hart1]|eukprot:CCW71124.1 unnamed protein product [Phytomonas sp. isolate Hart1]